MFHVQLEFQDFVRHHMWADHEMGVPEEGWSITVDFQNVYESAWLGAPCRISRRELPRLRGVPGR